MEFRGISKSYRVGKGTFAVLENVSLGIGRGEFVSLLGPSGGGKSTLLDILAGLEAPDAGQVRIANGEPRDRPAEASLPGGPLPVPPPPIADMQQKDLLLPWRTLWDNVLIAPELVSSAERRRVEPLAAELLRAYGLDGFQKAYPAQLSGGMRQRAALIRTLLCEREILLLDEPFGALDAITRGRLQQLLLRVWREYGKTVLLVTHDVEEALLMSDRVVVLSARPGRVLRDIPVNLPQAVRARSPETLRLKQQILEMLEEHHE